MGQAVSWARQGSTQPRCGPEGAHRVTGRQTRLGSHSDRARRAEGLTAVPQKDGLRPRGRMLERTWGTGVAAGGTPADGEQHGGTEHEVDVLGRQALGLAHLLHHPHEHLVWASPCSRPRTAHRRRCQAWRCGAAGTAGRTRSRDGTWGSTAGLRIGTNVDRAGGATPPAGHVTHFIPSAVQSVTLAGWLGKVPLADSKKNGLHSNEMPPHL